MSLYYILYYFSIFFFIAIPISFNWYIFPDKIFSSSLNWSSSFKLTFKLSLYNSPELNISLSLYKEKLIISPFVSSWNFISWKLSMKSLLYNLIDLNPNLFLTLSKEGFFVIWFKFVMFLIRADWLSPSLKFFLSFIIFCFWIEFIFFGVFDFFYD